MTPHSFATQVDSHKRTFGAEDPFKTAIDLTEEAGVSLSFCSADDFLLTNQQNSKDWLPLLPLFDARFSCLRAENSFFILGKDCFGDVVACQAGRFFNWPNTSFKEEAETLRLFYEDPKSMKRANEKCTVTSLAAGGTTGRVFFSGGAWYRKDFRGKGLVGWLPRIARMYALARWDANITVTVMAEKNVAKGVFPRNGYSNLEWGVEFENAPFGDLNCAYLWIKQEELFKDMQDFELRNRVNREGSFGLVCAH